MTPLLRRAGRRRQGVTKIRCRARFNRRGGNVGKASSPQAPVLGNSLGSGHFLRNQAIGVRTYRSISGTRIENPRVRTGGFFKCCAEERLSPSYQSRIRLPFRRWHPEPSIHRDRRRRRFSRSDRLAQQPNFGCGRPDKGWTRYCLLLKRT
jgi:hypothetical protein